MRITDLLDARRIRLGASASDKTQVIDLLVGLQCDGGAIADREGTPFREQQLRADLNLSRGKGLEPGETLEFL